MCNLEKISAEIVNLTESFNCYAVFYVCIHWTERFAKFFVLANDFDNREKSTSTISQSTLIESVDFLTCLETIESFQQTVT